MNISASASHLPNFTKALSALSQSARIQTSWVIPSQEACGCHLETLVGLHQANIPQRQMGMRQAGLVAAQRGGWNIIYRLTHPGIVPALLQIAGILGDGTLDFDALRTRPVPNCPCPQCNPGLNPESSCKNRSHLRIS